MRVLLVILIGLGCGFIVSVCLSGCGNNSSSSANPTSIPTPGPLPNQMVYTMTASRSEPGDGNTPAVQSFVSTGTATVPSTAQANSDATDAINATLVIGSVSCSYNKPANSNTYSFHDCTGGYTPGQSVTFPNNTNTQFFIQSGYCTQNCQAQINVTVTQ